MAGVRKSVVRNAVNSAVKRVGKSAVGKIGSTDRLRDMLLRSTQDAPPKAFNGKPEPLAATRIKGADKEAGESARRMIDDVRENDPVLAALLNAKPAQWLQGGRGRKTGGRKPGALPSMEKAYSSNVDKIGYDEDKKQLFITFKSGAVYQYFEVPKLVYEDLLYVVNSGASVGARFWDLVRVRGSKVGTRYSYRKIKEGKR